ncbi:translation elongation factor ts [Chryseobacterium sp. StRB126]|nr:translation elongation factor ts [Chryseobacterium sp. StRB126]
MSYTPVAADVAKLRNQTGAGMMDCKKALVEAEGDFEKAVDILRKKGQKVAANRADRESTEGAVIARVNEDNTLGAIISLNCETDFVGKNEAFIELAYELAEMAIFAATKEELLATDFHGMTVAEKLIEQTGVIGRKNRNWYIRKNRRTIPRSLYPRWKQNCCDHFTFCKSRRS